MSGHAHPDELTELELHQVGLCRFETCPVCARDRAEREKVDLIARLTAEVKQLRASEKALQERLAELNGPECKDQECPDYDGEHPYHQNVVVRFWEKKQKEYDLIPKKEQ